MDIDAAVQMNLNYAWVLLCAALVFSMQGGFMCLEAGLARAKNSINVAIKNLADLVVAVIVFWTIGFGLMFGATKGGVIGASDFFVNADNPWHVTLFVFQAVFVGTAATIDSGAVAGRTKFRSYLIISALISGLIYPVFGHWAWGSLLHEQAGWLEAMGFKDFAGSAVVHSVGGWTALVGIIILGPRIGKFNADGTSNRIAPHNMAFAYLGTFILFFGWFGFNCGSALAVTPRIAGIAMNTLLSGCFGCLSCSALSWIFSPMKRPEGEMIANGMLGGLVGVTAGCAYVGVSGAVIIGLVSGVCVYGGALLVERVLKLDDVVGAVAVHGVCGAWGTIAVGLFILPERLGGLTRLEQIGVQALGAVVCFLWTFGVGFILMWLVNRFSGGMRVSRDDELIGLNISEHGASSSILDLVHAMHAATAAGRFTEDVKVEVEIGTEMGDLAAGFNKMVDAVRHYLSETEKQIVIARKAQSKAESMQSELKKSRKKHLEYVETVADNLKEMMAETESTLQTLSTAAAEVQADASDLHLESEKIDAMLDVIHKLSASSKILALNAQVEAARAGEANSGFNVVARQMADFAKQTVDAADEIASVSGVIRTGLGKMQSSAARQYASLVRGGDNIRNACDLVQSLIHGDDKALPENV